MKKMCKEKKKKKRAAIAAESQAMIIFQVEWQVDAWTFWNTVFAVLPLVCCIVELEHAKARAKQKFIGFGSHIKGTN